MCICGRTIRFAPKLWYQTHLEATPRRGRGAAAAPITDGRIANAARRRSVLAVAGPSKAPIAFPPAGVSFDDVAMNWYITRPANRWRRRAAT